MDESIIDKTLKLTDYYEILNSKNDASEEQIKQAYKKVTSKIKLALKLHPDKNKDPRA